MFFNLHIDTNIYNKEARNVANDTGSNIFMSEAVFQDGVEVKNWLPGPW